MPARSIPEKGDVVVREEMRNGTRIYVLHTFPAADECTYGLLEDFRMVESV
jgi:hypothetical protein